MDFHPPLRASKGIGQLLVWSCAAHHLYPISAVCFDAILTKLSGHLVPQRHDASRLRPRGAAVVGSVLLRTHAGWKQPSLCRHAGVAPDRNRKAMLTMQIAIAATHVLRAVIRTMSEGIRVHRFDPFHGLIHLFIGKTQGFLLIPLNPRGEMPGGAPVLRDNGISHMTKRTSSKIWG
jgi:hypothetical protein